ncbi:MAG: flavodoxin-dependent (E)-4-hydroxy-3-methylbut-2-enyl-diphosphate synthase [Firmicutes bacterium]|nr:flavodoxin-dependent (E)-4-hydroxy-3-methylbut-2-enyl-diphosphate synthase [Bacillota bacterium]
MDLETRRKSRQLNLGGVKIGGGAPVSVQSMTKTDTRDVEATVGQIEDLARAGCDIVRVAVVDSEAAEAVRQITARSSIPLVADIHFDYKLALSCIENGIDGLRLNPGNIGSEDRVEMVARRAQEKGIPIRIGVNSGSLEKSILARYGGVTAEAMVESALTHIGILERVGFFDIKVSLKASSVPLMIDTYRRLASRVDYPLHLGVTEAGTRRVGTVKSAIGIGVLLESGIGDTIRVSLTGPPVEEVRVGREILKSLGLMEAGPEIISCPTCGRCEIDLVDVAERLEEAIADLKTPLKIAVMGCTVNGPGEARQADVGLAGGKGVGLIFREGQPRYKVKQGEMLNALLKEIREMSGQP